MYYLTIFIHQSVEGKEYAQSTTRYEDYETAKTEWHVACASYRKKETTLEFTAVVSNVLGQSMLNDHFVPVVVTATEETAEAAEESAE